LLICGGGAADAAKLCVVAISNYSYAYNASTGIWAVGVGCGETSGGQSTGDKPGTTPAELCDGAVVISGTSEITGGGACSCRATYPITLFPRTYNSGLTTIYDAGFCSKACGNIFRTTPGSAVLL
jgi:hypothetical protein